MAIRITSATKKGRTNSPRNPMIVRIEERILAGVGPKNRQVTIDMLDVVEPEVADALRRATDGEFLAGLSPAKLSEVIARTEAVIEPAWRAFRSSVSNVSYRLKQRGLSHTTHQQVERGVVMSAIVFDFSASPSAARRSGLGDLVATLVETLPSADDEDADADA